MLGHIIVAVSGFIIGVGTPSKTGRKGEWSRQIVSFGFFLSLVGVGILWMQRGFIEALVGLLIAIVLSGLFASAKR